VLGWITKSHSRVHEQMRDAPGICAGVQSSTCLTTSVLETLLVYLVELSDGAHTVARPPN
jgi:hypothetical protein